VFQLTKPQWHFVSKRKDNKTLSPLLEDPILNYISNNPNNKRVRILSDDLSSNIETTSSLGSQSSHNNNFSQNDQTENKDKIKINVNRPNNFQPFPFISIKNVSDFQKKTMFKKFAKNSTQKQSPLARSKAAPKQKKSVQKNTILKYLHVT